MLKCGTYNYHCVSSSYNKSWFVLNVIFALQTNPSWQTDSYSVATQTPRPSCSVHTMTLMCSVHTMTSCPHCSLHTRVPTVSCVSDFPTKFLFSTRVQHICSLHHIADLLNPTFLHSIRLLNESNSRDYKAPCAVILSILVDTNTIRTKAGINSTTHRPTTHLALQPPHKQ
jgi:hypothetical protein